MLLEEIQKGGLGDELIRESLGANDHKVSVTHLLEWVHVMEHGLLIIQQLAEIFGSVEVLEQFNEYFKLRVLRQDKSIGFVFGLMESNKEKFHIAEYSASQTTLEQIFQMFAKMSLRLESEAGPRLFVYDPASPEKVRLEKIG